MTARREPPASDEARPFWDATREQRFVLPWCTTCDAAVWYPRTVCPRCFGDTVEWREDAGGGTVYAASVHTRPGLGGPRKTARTSWCSSTSTPACG